MWEIENGRQYKMSKAHDIYSGLGSSNTPTPAVPEDLGLTEASLSTIDETGSVEGGCDDSLDSSDRASSEKRAADKMKERLQQRKLEDQIALEISKAESIVSTFDGVKVI